MNIPFAIEVINTSSNYLLRFKSKIIFLFKHFLTLINNTTKNILSIWAFSLKVASQHNASHQSTNHIQFKKLQIEILQSAKENLFNEIMINLRRCQRTKKKTCETLAQFQQTKLIAWESVLKNEWIAASKARLQNARLLTMVLAARKIQHKLGIVGALVSTFFFLFCSTDCINATFFFYAFFRKHHKGNEITKAKGNERRESVVIN